MDHRCKVAVGLLSGDYSQPPDTDTPTDTPTDMPTDTAAAEKSKPTEVKVLGSVAVSCCPGDTECV